MNYAQFKLKSKIGDLYLVASEKGLRGLQWMAQSPRIIESISGSAPEVQHLADAVRQLTEYFEGDRREFDLSLDLEGTLFQKKVWIELRKIPYGSTVSYKDLARSLKNEGAVRAVGTANGKNPICIIVPCHRVIASDGTLGGYSGGLAVKSELLRMERELLAGVASHARLATP